MCNIVNWWKEKLFRVNLSWLTYHMGTWSHDHRMAWSLSRSEVERSHSVLFVNQTFLYFCSIYPAVSLFSFCTRLKCSTSCLWTVSTLMPQTYFSFLILPMSHRPHSKPLSCTIVQPLLYTAQVVLPLNYFHLSILTTNPHQYKSKSPSVFVQRSTGLASEVFPPWSPKPKVS